MTDPEIFIVRIWRQLAGGFRATARRVEDEETRQFSQPEEVTRFLSAAVAPTTPTDDAAHANTPPATTPLGHIHLSRRP